MFMHYKHLQVNNKSIRGYPLVSEIVQGYKFDDEDHRIIVGQIAFSSRDGKHLASA